MNINQQQGGPNPGQPWLPQPQGQGQNYGYQGGPPQAQGMRPGMAMVPPKSSTGPSAMQQVPMFSTQNGNVTPPASLNPGMNMGTGPPQQPMNQMNKQMANMQINQARFPVSQTPPASQPAPFDAQKGGMPQNFAPGFSTAGPIPNSAGNFMRPRMAGPPGTAPGPHSGPPPRQPSGPPSRPPGPLSGPSSGPSSGLSSGPPSGLPLGQFSRPPGNMGGNHPGMPGQQPPTSYPMTSQFSGPPGPTNMMRQPFSSQNEQNPMLSSSSLSGPPVSSQPPTVDSGRGQAPGPYQPGQQFQGQGPMIGGQPPATSQRMYPSSQFSAPVPGAGPMQRPPSGPGGMPGVPGQPGHGAGPISSPMQQPPKRIDPDQMPNPIQVMSDDQDQWQKGLFQTSMRGKLPPLVSTKCKVQDDGNCSPRFMRSTMYNVPCNQDMLKESQIPLAIISTPFAKLPEDENKLYLVDNGPSGPVRCNRCKAYMNPFMQFIDGGRRFVCNICSHSSEVPQEYFCHLDHQGRRVDVYERAELCFGSYEFVATTDYCKDEKFPSPPAFIFMIDVSYQSIQCGMVKRLTKELHTILDNLPKETGMEESLIKVGFVTYSSSLHFYNVKDNLAQPQMMVVSDINDVFVPLVDGFLVDVKKAKVIVDSLLDMIPDLFSETRETDVILGPVVQAGMEALKAANISGKVFIFHTSLPIMEAPGKLRNREDRKLLGTDKEKTILAPQSQFYTNLAKDCVSNGVSVDLFLFPNSYVDVATIGLLATQTGGQIYRYSYFKDATHGKQFIEDLKKNLERDIGFDAIMRLRCSTGLRPVDFYGSFVMNNTTDVELGAIDSEKAIAIEIKHDDKIPEDGVAFMQCALLYTSVSGQRRLRIHNLAFNCCSQLSDLYRCCELDALMNFLIKHSLRQILNSNPQTIKDTVIQRCAHMLSCYRQHCATPSTSGQLILPECMKLLPLYLNSLIKSDVLAGGSEMSSDDRAFLMQAALSMNLEASVLYLYPRLYPLHNIDLDHDAELVPDILRCSIERMEDNGVYLLENGISMFIWVGLQASSDILQSLFNANTIGQVDIEMTQLPVLDTPLSKRVRAVITQIQSERQRFLKLSIVRQRDKLEPWLKHYLVEDKGFHAQQLSYVDFLCHIHKEIRNLLN
ncbi:protein transport protein Sec24C-like [Rhopilema esculentum]|uniref:protein transport protein Sec24C-like n=1 Tax=Rhopilema esculentum TaxID=499914 RepID=UPI0031E001DF